MAFLLLPLEADFGFSQVERVLAFRPDRLAASKSATGGQKWHLTATGGRFWQSAGCHWRSILPNETESWPPPPPPLLPPLPPPPRTKKGALGRGSPDDVDDVICALDQPLANRVHHDTRHLCARARCLGLQLARAVCLALAVDNAIGDAPGERGHGPV